ncbi:MAG: M48 family metallopeptidase [Acidobacteriota bacterium]|jgi:predicted Zn-dependent protease|nr:M48 family metallopeptidase [Acidobacteriota bacterium]
MKRLKIFLLAFVAVSVVLTAIDLKKLKKAVDITKKGVEAQRKITEKEEYFIGRAVGATILKRYKLDRNNEVSAYLTQLGTYIALRSERPQTFLGYRFALLDTDEVNAFAAPSGIIFVTRGLVEACEDEDELAAALAHEVSHIVSRDPTQAIKSDRMKGFAMTTAAELARGGNETVQLFRNMVSDVSNTLLEKGYSRSQEKKADLAAVALLEKCGFNSAAIVSLLESFAEREVRKAAIYSAHPSAQKRLEYLRVVVSAPALDAAYRNRKARFSRIRDLCRN